MTRKRRLTRRFLSLEPLEERLCLSSVPNGTALTQPDAATQAQKDFEAQFREKALPSVIESLVFPLDRPRKLFRLLVDLELFNSNSEAQRKIKEGAVYMAVANAGQTAWQRMTDPTWDLDPHQHPFVTFRVGSRRILQVAFKT